MKQQGRNDGPHYMDYAILLLLAAGLLLLLLYNIGPPTANIFCNISNGIDATP